MTIADYKSDDFVTVSKKTPLEEVAEILCERHFVIVVPAGSDQAIGFFSQTDLLWLLDRQPDLDLSQKTVEEVMAQPLFVVELYDAMEDAIRELSRRRVSQLVVVERMRPVGVITQAEVIRWKLDQAKARKRKK